MTKYSAGLAIFRLMSARFIIQIKHELHLLTSLMILVLIAQGFGNTKYVRVYRSCLSIFAFPFFQSYDMSCDMRFPTMWYVQPAKAQTSLCIRTVWSEPLLVARIFYECSATDRTSFGVSKLKRRLDRIVWVYTCQNTTLLEITCRGSSFICLFVRLSILIKIIAFAVKFS